MSNPVPSDLALTVIQDGAAILSSDHRNNYAAIQTAVNDLIAALEGGVAGEFLAATDGSDVEWAYPPGYEIGYDQITSPVNITGTSLSAATTVIAGSAYTFDGSAVMVEAFSPEIVLPEATGPSGALVLVLFEGSTALAVLGAYTSPATSQSDYPFLARYRFMPSAASHTYSLKAWVGSTTGTPNVQAGAGTSGTTVTPAYLRFTKV